MRQEDNEMYAYGPIKSIRLGRTLYVNIVPTNVCSYNCVYCHCGATRFQSSVREKFYPFDDIMAEIINRAYHTAPRHISFIGEGEPTLSRDLGSLIEQTRLKTEVPIVICTNGSLLFRKDVRQDLAGAEVVIIKIDAGDEGDFLKTNRPLNNLDYQMIIGGMTKFRGEFDGQIWVDVMLVKNVNDAQQPIISISETIQKIRPNQIYVRTLTSPPAEPNVRPAETPILEFALSKFGNIAPTSLWKEGSVEVEGFIDARQALLEISRKHPLAKNRALELERAFSAPGIVAQLIETRELTEIEYENNKYLSPSGAESEQRYRLSSEGNT